MLGYTDRMTSISEKTLIRYVRFVDFFPDGKLAKWLPLRRKFFCHRGRKTVMFKKLKELYKAYKPYVRVDLIMYAALILMIFLYFIISLLME